MRPADVLCFSLSHVILTLPPSPFPAFTALFTSSTSFLLHLFSNTRRTRLHPVEGRRDADLLSRQAQLLALLSALLRRFDKVSLSSSSSLSCKNSSLNGPCLCRSTLLRARRCLIIFCRRFRMRWSTLSPSTVRPSVFLSSPLLLCLPTEPEPFNRLLPPFVELLAHDLRAQLGKDDPQHSTRLRAAFRKHLFQAVDKEEPYPLIGKGGIRCVLWEQLTVGLTDPPSHNSVAHTFVDKLISLNLSKLKLSFELCFLLLLEDVLRKMVQVEFKNGEPLPLSLVEKKELIDFPVRIQFRTTAPASSAASLPSLPRSTRPLISPARPLLPTPSAATRPAFSRRYSPSSSRF